MRRSVLRKVQNLDSSASELGKKLTQHKQGLYGNKFGGKDVGRKKNMTRPWLQERFKRIGMHCGRSEETGPAMAIGTPFSTRLEDVHNQPF